MLRHLALLLLAAAALAEAPKPAPGPEIRPYPIAGKSPEVLANVLAAVNAERRRMDEAGAARDRQRWPAFTLRIVQHLGQGSYLALDTATAQPVHATFSAEHRELADGETVTVPARDTGRLFEYTTTAGVAVRVKSLEIKLTQVRPPLEMERFLELVKGGYNIAIPDPSHKTTLPGQQRLLLIQWADASPPP